MPVFFHPKSVLVALAAFVILGASGGDVRGHDFTAGSLIIGHPWARATIGTSRPGGAYLTITNKGGEADRLTGAECPIAERVELHRSSVEGGMMRMVPVGAIEVPAGGKVMFAPSGYHLMLLGLKKPLVAGSKVPLTLVFEKAGRITVEVAVEPLGGKGGTKGHMGHDGH
ncbi:MAG: copper chaperone PCu(A)C [Alphaproteobacteria bacterium]|nr:copper chaperone PCu(A)C [Alphaproteobacteria bacterium]